TMTRKSIMGVAQLYLASRSTESNLRWTSSTAIGDIAVALALAGGRHDSHNGGDHMRLGRQHAERRIGQQGIAGPDAIDQMIDEAVDHEEAIARLGLSVTTGQHAFVAKFEY